MGLTFPSAILFLTVLLVTILYLGSNDARGRGRILAGSAAVLPARLPGLDRGSAAIPLRVGSGRGDFPGPRFVGRGLSDDNGGRLARPDGGAGARVFAVGQIGRAHV